MSTPRDKIVEDFARWTALSATRTGSPIKSRKDVYGILNEIDFSPLFEVDRGPISDVEFNDWHETTVNRMQKYQPKLNAIWSAKIINIYLKTRCYVGGYGRDDLANVIHPPLDNSLIRQVRKILRAELDPSSSANTTTVTVNSHKLNLIDACLKASCIGRMTDIQTYHQYKDFIWVCRVLANARGISLFEVEQFWEATN